MRIARSICQNRFRTAKSQVEISSVSTDQPEILALVDARQSGSSMEADIQLRDYYRYLRGAIHEAAKTNKPPWDALDWKIFLLRYEENVFEAREIARRLGRSENTVKDRIYKRINVVLERVRAIVEVEEAALQQSSEPSVS